MQKLHPHLPRVQLSNLILSFPSERTSLPRQRCQVSSITLSCASQSAGYIGVIASKSDRILVNHSETDPTPAASSTSFKPNNTVNTQLPSNTSTAHQRSPKTRSAPSFISLPANAASSSNSTTSGFKLTTHQNEGLMLTPGGDDLPFVFKKRPNMQDRRPSREVFA